LREFRKLKGAAFSAPFSLSHMAAVGDRHWTMLPVLSLCVLSLLFVLPLRGAHADILTGRWKITLTPDKETAERGEKEFTDTISFADGRFISTALAAKGFKPSKYRGDFEEREAEFDLDQESANEGVVIWIGEVRKGRMAGRLQWKKKDGTNVSFNFTGAKDSP
jgi:hypothetical protein